jgi:cell division protein FtsN
MEQKQSLWIIAAVGVFLLVVIGAAVILYSPTAVKADSRTAVTSSVQQLPEQPGSPEEAPVLQLQDLSVLQQQQASAVPANTASMQAVTVTASDGSTISVPTQSPQYVAILQALGANSPQQPAPAQNSPVQSVNDLTVFSGTTHVIGTGTTTVNGSGLSVPATSPATEINIQTVMPINNMAREAVGNNKTATSTASVPTPVKTTATATTPAKTTASVKTIATPTVTQDWVQAASFETKKNADTARGTLEENRIPGEVFTYTGSDGRLYYRVRVGPYETKSEAERAQTVLRRIKNFESNQTFVVNSTNN